MGFGESMGPPQSAGSWVATTPGCSCRLGFQPADACTWLFGNSGHPTWYGCADGSARADRASHGGRARCPRSAARMCERLDEAGDYSCSRICASIDGDRRCHQLDVGEACVHKGKIYDSIASFVVPFSNMHSRAGLSKPQACQELCQKTSGCAAFSANLNDCSLFPSVARLTYKPGYTSGPRTCLPHIERSGLVMSSIFGYHAMVYSCIDALGQRSEMSTRSVQVGCEGPNPPGMFGGNKLVCAVPTKTMVVASNAECSFACFAAGELVCEAYEKTGRDCKFLTKCDGRYHRDESETREVGYCARQDEPPKVVNQGLRTSLTVHEDWDSGRVRCYDKEDALPAKPVLLTEVNTGVPGMYLATFLCSDTKGSLGSAGSTSSSCRNVATAKTAGNAPRARTSSGWATRACRSARGRSSP